MPLDYTRPIRVKATHEKVEILRTDLRHPFSILAVITFADGTHYGNAYPRDYGSWENVPEPKRSGDGVVNVYEGGGLVPYHSRKRGRRVGRPRPPRLRSGPLDGRGGAVSWIVGLAEWTDLRYRLSVDRVHVTALLRLAMHRTVVSTDGL